MRLMTPLQETAFKIYSSKNEILTAACPTKLQDFYFCSLIVGCLNRARALSLIGNEPSEDWPQRGEIKMQSISVRYARELDPVIKNVSVTFKSQEKVDIVQIFS